MQFVQDGFFNQHDKLMFHILEIIQEHNEPIGAGLLCEKLKSHGFYSGEANVGRILRKMDFQNITKRIGYQGRVLTDYGRKVFTELQSKKQHTYYGLELINVLGKSSSREIEDILLVRKILEREAARLAALRITEAELAELARIVAKSKEITNATEEIAQFDAAFHGAIAKFSKNKVLEAGLNILVHNEDLYKLFSHIRRQVGRAIMEDHFLIFDAIKQRDADLAERLTSEHIERVLKDVHKYFQDKETVR